MHKRAIREVVWKAVDARFELLGLGLLFSPIPASAAAYPSPATPASGFTDALRDAPVFPPPYNEVAKGGTLPEVIAAVLAGFFYFFCFPHSRLSYIGLKSELSIELEAYTGSVRGDACLSRAGCTVNLLSRSFFSL
jgi:hypothetical protein